MDTSDVSTTVAAELCGVPVWKVRRAADALGDRVKRIGPYRAIPRAALPALMAEMDRRGWLPKEQLTN